MAVLVFESAAAGTGVIASDLQGGNLLSIRRLGRGRSSSMGQRRRPAARSAGPPAIEDLVNAWSHPSPGLRPLHAGRQQVVVVGVLVPDGSHRRERDRLRIE